MGLLLMALEQGTQVKIGVSGPDEDIVCQKLVGLFETEFDFRHKDKEVADPGHAVSGGGVECQPLVPEHPGRV